MENTKNKKIIIANWKMNPETFSEARELFNAVKKETRKLENIEVVIAPPALWLAQLKINDNDNIELGAQNMHWEEKGAFTGEISPIMLKDAMVKYVILGHSERRINFGETDEMVNAKILAAFKNKLTPILCIGETFEEKKEEKTQDVFKKQINNAFVDITEYEIEANKIFIVYEPIWAIGSGFTPAFDDILSARLLIKKILAGLYGRRVADKVPVLYGGSVSVQNAKDIINKGGMDGLLVGGASIKAGEFINIIRAVAN
ncbi:triose-phosphate isomerase [Patescibacteria group bacterium]|nr:triose-phosphate isomerase [Patescibacteria group bacterium]MBU4580016.1 triose-phosphate isomerase [Patescibacteria group bacterium]